MAMVVNDSKAYRLQMIIYKAHWSYNYNEWKYQSMIENPIPKSFLTNTSFRFHLFKLPTGAHTLERSWKVDTEDVVF